MIRILFYATNNSIAVILMKILYKMSCKAATYVKIKTYVQKCKYHGPMSSVVPMK